MIIEVVQKNNFHWIFKLSMCDDTRGYERYPLVNIHIAIENGPVEILDLPIQKNSWFTHKPP